MRFTIFPKGYVKLLTTSYNRLIFLFFDYNRNPAPSLAGFLFSIIRKFLPSSVFRIFFTFALPNDNKNNPHTSVTLLRQGSGCYPVGALV